jgi:hypothetical protein
MQLVCQKRCFARVLILQERFLFAFGVGPLTYNLFHLLYSIISDAENEKENYWVKLNKETLTYFWKEFENDGKHKLWCIGEQAILFVHIFGRILLTFGLENTKKCSNYLVHHMMSRYKKLAC